MKFIPLALLFVLFAALFAVTVQAQDPIPTQPYRSACEQFYLEHYNIVTTCGREFDAWQPNAMPTQTPYYTPVAPMPTEARPRYATTLYRVRVRTTCDLSAPVLYVAPKASVIELTGDRVGDWYYTAGGGCVLERGTNAQGQVIINLILGY